MAIIEYDHSPNISPEQMLRSLADSVRRAFEELESQEQTLEIKECKPVTLEELGGYPKTGGDIEGDASIDGILKLIKNGAYIAGTTTDGRVLGQFTPLNDSNYCLVGYGGYDQSVGSTRIFGQDITFTSTAAGLANRSYGVNKVLWSGYMFMFASQTATLSEAISAQPHGIVLVFSLYSGGEALDSHWTCFFVPKYIPAHHTAQSSEFLLVGTNYQIVRKILYISNTGIKGNDINTATGTASNNTYANNQYVLRYVIGV